MEALLILTSLEEVYVEKILSDIYTRPHSSYFVEDKEFLMYLSKMVNQLVEIQPNYHFSPSTCTAFSSKLHCDAMTLAIDNELEMKKRVFGDPEGHMNYVDTL